MSELSVELILGQKGIKRGTGLDDGYAMNFGESLATQVKYVDFDTVRCNKAI